MSFVNQKGYTLVELMVALTVSAIVLTAISIMVSGSHEYVNEGRKGVQLQQDFSLIAELLSRKIRQSIQGQHKIYASYSAYTSNQPAQSSGSCLKLNFPSGDSTVIYKDNLDFKIRNPDLSTTNLVPGVVNNLVFFDGTRSIQTTIELAQGNANLFAILVDAFRNFKGSGGSEGEADWPYAIFANNSVDLSAGGGTITGNVHANNNYTISSSYTVSGTITKAPPTVTAPTVNWSFFENAAIAVGQRVSGDKTFNSAGSPYTGVWYITNTVTIQNNAVINGTIVARNNCNFPGKSVNVTATPATYAALVIENSITIDNTNVAINGFVYSGNDVDIKKNNFSLTGAVVSMNTLKGEGGNKIITYDANYLTNLNGITF